MGTERADVGSADGKNESNGCEYGNALSVLATAGELDIARSTPSRSPMYRKPGQALASPLEFWSEDNGQTLEIGQPKPSLERKGETDLHYEEPVPESGDKPSSAEPLKPCNCRNSGCLKRYCDCFNAGMYCLNCNCQNCKNNENHLAEREKAISRTLDKDQNAFRPKITKMETDVKHNKGCHCKKTACLKGYCECFQAGVHCSDLCKCTTCKNFEGSSELQSVRASQQQNGGPLQPVVDAPEESEHNWAKRPRLERPISSLDEVMAIDRSVPSTPKGKKSLVSPTPILHRSGQPGTNEARSLRWDATALLTRQCKQLVQIAQEELKEAVVGEKGPSNGEAGGEDMVPHDSDLQRTIERAVIEETAAMLVGYRHMLRSRTNS